MEEIKKRVLVVCPSFPVVESGAEQMDRAEGIRQLVRLGCEVAVLAKVVAWAEESEIERVAREMGVKKVICIPYKFSNKNLTFFEKVLKFLGKFRNPLYFDGAAYEYSEPQIQQALKETLISFKPDIVWFEYTYLWPLYGIVKKFGVPIITHSANFEPKHFLEEQGPSLLNRLKYIPKWLGERHTARVSDILTAITPAEEKIYKFLKAKKTIVLPLRSLSRFTNLPPVLIRNSKPLHIFFMGSSYAVEHNKAAARQIIEEIAPAALAREPEAFIFHIFGGKLPQELQDQCNGTSVIYEGYVPDLERALEEMDVALIPSSMGAGMQQKVFEPLARGIPTITSPRAIAGYPFKNGKEFVGAHSTEEFVKVLLALQDQSLRKELSKNALEKSSSLFSREALDAIVRSVLTSI